MKKSQKKDKAHIIESSHLKLIAAYWCNSSYVNDDFAFEEAYNQVNEAAQKVSERTRVLLELGISSAPTEAFAYYFAAGPLEDYVDLILREKNADEASFIVRNPYTSSILDGVWRDIHALRKLAISKRMAEAYGNPLATLQLSQAMSFWCYLFADKEHRITFKPAYDAVNARLNEIPVRNDLMLTAPSADAEDLLSIDTPNN